MRVILLIALLFSIIALYEIKQFNRIDHKPSILKVAKEVSKMNYRQIILKIVESSILFIVLNMREHYYTLFITGLLVISNFVYIFYFKKGMHLKYIKQE